MTTSPGRVKEVEGLQQQVREANRRALMNEVLIAACAILQCSMWVLRQLCYVQATKQEMEWLRQRVLELEATQTSSTTAVRFASDLMSNVMEV